MALDQWTKSCDTYDSVQYLSAHTYAEYVTSGRFVFQYGQSVATRVFLVLWDDLFSFCDDILGYAYRGNDDEIIRVLPEKHPRFLFYATDVSSVEGMAINGTDSNDVAKFRLAKVTVNFRPLPYPVKSDEDIDYEYQRYVEIQKGYQLNFQTIQGRMQWVSRTNASEKVIDVQPTIQLPRQELTMIWHDVPAKEDPFVCPTEDAITSCNGKVNSTMFMGRYYPDTILFFGAEPELITPRLSDDVYYWRIRYKFSYVDNGEGLDYNTLPGINEQEHAGHNYQFDPKNNRFDKLTHDGNSTGRPTYQSTDLNILWGE